jgi:hypothetical protein
MPGALRSAARDPAGEADVVSEPNIGQLTSIHPHEMSPGKLSKPAAIDAGGARRDEAD